MRIRTLVAVIAIPLGVLAFVREVGPWISGEYHRRNYRRLSCVEWAKREAGQRGAAMELMIPDLQAAERKRLGSTAPVPAGTAAAFGEVVATACQEPTLATRPVFEVAERLWLNRGLAPSPPAAPPDSRRRRR